MSLVLCVDCGGSKTSAVITNEKGEIVGRGLGGPSNFSYMSTADFQEAIRTAVSKALQSRLSPESTEPVALPVPPGTFACAWFGISGVDSAAAARNAGLAISPLVNVPLGQRLTVANDTHLLAAPLRLHTDIRHAVTAIAGTGSCVVSFTLDESGTLVELARTGGWGWILGDEGGGFHVGRETMRVMMDDLARASLGMAVGRGSKLKARVLARFGITGEENAAEVLPMIHVPEGAVAREKRLSELSRLVFEGAFEDGDEFGLRVLRNCADALAAQIAMLCVVAGDEHKPRGVKADEAILCFGGSLVGVDAYRQLVLDALARRGCAFRYVTHVEDAAAVGAVTLAKCLP